MAEAINNAGFHQCGGRRYDGRSFSGAPAKPSASHLEASVCGPSLSLSPTELNQLGLLCRVVVGHFASTMGSVGLNPTTRSTLHYREAVENHGIIPDASSSEFAHQQSKLVGRSSGSDVAANFARPANTNAATPALAKNLEYDVSMYDCRRKEHVRVQVRPSPGCMDAMKQLGNALRLGFSGAPREDYAAPTLTPAPVLGQYPGGATWTGMLWQEGDEDVVEGHCLDRVKSENLRPDALALLKGNITYYECDGWGAGVPCDNSRCPWFSVNPNALENVDIVSSRYCHATPYVASSGQGRWTGGDAKSVSRPGPRLDWTLGAGGGDDVEIWENPPPDADKHAQVDPSK